MKSEEDLAGSTGVLALSPPPAPVAVAPALRAARTRVAMPEPEKFQRNDHRNSTEHRTRLSPPTRTRSVAVGLLTCCSPVWFYYAMTVRSTTRPQESIETETLRPTLGHLKADQTFSDGTPVYASYVNAWNLGARASTFPLTSSLLCWVPPRTASSRAAIQSRSNRR